MNNCVNANPKTITPRVPNAGWKET